MQKYQRVREEVFAFKQERLPAAYPQKVPEGTVRSIEQAIIANVGDWVVLYPNGSVSVLTEENFRKLFAPVEQNVGSRTSESKDCCGGINVKEGGPIIKEGPIIKDGPNVKWPHPFGSRDFPPREQIIWCIAPG